MELDTQVIQDRQEQQGRLALQGRLEKQVLLEKQEQQGRLALQGRQEKRVRRDNLEQLILHGTWLIMLN